MNDRERCECGGEESKNGHSSSCLFLTPSFTCLFWKVSRFNISVCRMSCSFFHAIFFFPCSSFLSASSALPVLRLLTMSVLAKIEEIEAEVSWE